MIWRCDEHGIEVRAVQKFLVVHVLPGAPRLLRRRRQAFLIDVTHRNHLDVLLLLRPGEHHLQQRRPSNPESDEADVHPVVGAENHTALRPAEGAGCGRDPEESPARRWRTYHCLPSSFRRLPLSYRLNSSRVRSTPGGEAPDSPAFVVGRCRIAAPVGTLSTAPAAAPTLPLVNSRSTSSLA